jgi:hypothetical protein
MANDFAPVTVEEFLAVFGEFGDVPQAAVQFRLDLAMKQDKAEWGDYWRQAVMLMAAHALALRFNLSEKAAESGRMNPYMTGLATSQSASPSSLSQSFQLPAGALGDDPFTVWMYRTAYGQEWLALLIMVIPPGGVVRSPPITGRMPKFYSEFVGVGGI